MSTRSTIALEFADGSVSQVYCHCDGYIEYNGRVLLNDYSDPFVVRELIDRGNLFCLNSTVEKSEFYSNGDVSEPAESFKSFNEYVLKASMEEYNYILRRDGTWYVDFKDYDGNNPTTFKLTLDQAVAQSLVAA